MLLGMEVLGKGIIGWIGMGCQMSCRTKDTGSLWGKGVSYQVTPSAFATSPILQGPAGAGAYYRLVF